MLRAKDILRALRWLIPRDPPPHEMASRHHGLCCSGQVDTDEARARYHANIWRPACNLEDDVPCVDCGGEDE